MKSHLLILFLFTFSLISIGQNEIIYDLDSYKRVNFDYRVTTFSPDMDISYFKKLNTPSEEKFYIFNLGGRYVDNHTINNGKNQKTYYSRINLNVLTGSVKEGGLSYAYNYNNRSYFWYEVF